MAAWRYEISLLFSTLEEKFRISARPCNIHYVCSSKNKVPVPLTLLHLFQSSENKMDIGDTSRSQRRTFQFSSNSANSSVSYVTGSHK